MQGKRIDSSKQIERPCVALPKSSEIHRDISENLSHLSWLTGWRGTSFHSRRPLIAQTTEPPSRPVGSAVAGCEKLTFKGAF